MINIEELRTIDIPLYRKVFDKVNEIYESFEGVYYKLTYKGQQYVLHRNGCIFTLINVLSNKCDVFTVDPEMNIQGLIVDNESFRYLDGDLIGRSMKTGITENISLIKRDNNLDEDGYNGFVLHVQYDAKKDLRVIRTYQHMYNAEERIYPMHLKKPFTVVFEDKVSKADNGEIAPRMETYIKSDYDLREEPIGFGIATIKDFGLIPFLQNGSYSLQKQDQITRYYKVLGKHKDLSAITFFPLCKQYRIEDINEKAKELGFKTEISERLLEIYNGDDEMLKLFKEIIETIKSVEMEREDHSFGYRIS